MSDDRKTTSERWHAFWRRPVRDVADELQFHLDMRIEEARQAGLDPDAARATALERFGEYHAIHGELMRIDTARERRRSRSEWIADARRDIVFAWRSLRAAPAFAAAAIATLAIAIGANTAIYSVVHAVLLAPLPYAHSDQLVTTWGSGLGELDALRGRWRSAEALAASQPIEANVDDGSIAEHLPAAVVTDGFFGVLGVSPQIGRAFTDQENVPGQNSVVILSDGFWRRRFAADRAVLGRTLVIEGRPRTIVGVMPARFAIPSSSVAFWLPAAMNRGNPAAMWTSFGFQFIARLRPGLSVEAAAAQLREVAPRLRTENPVWLPPPSYGTNATVTSLRDSIVGETRPILRIVMGCALLVLLIACINVANLLLARATARQRELAVRAALGGGRRRLVRQLLTESVVLSGAGAICGVLLAAGGLRWLVAALPADIPSRELISINAAALAVALVLAILTGLSFGALPAIRATRSGATDGLVRAGRGGRGVGHQRVSALLVCGEIALAVLVVTGAQLLVRSFRELRRLDPGFSTAGIVTARITPTVIPYGDPARADALYGTLVSRLQAFPGVTQVALVNALPLANPAGGIALRVQGKFENARATLPWANHLQMVSPAYFSALGIPVRAGRAFTDADRRESEPVAIVSENVARAQWPGESPIGKRIGYPFESPWMTVVGVVADVKSDNLRDTTVSAVYVPFLQRPLDQSGRARTEYTLVARASGDPLAAARAIPEIVRALDHSVPVGMPQTMDQVLANSVGSARFTMVLVSSFALVALVLGAIGIYGVMSYVVGQRAQELSVRTALGATSHDLQRMVLQRAATLAAIGAIAGSGLGLVATRPLSALLYGISTADPLTLVTVPVLFIVVALAASVGPARRASRVSPASVLRGD